MPSEALSSPPAPTDWRLEGRDLHGPYTYFSEGGEHLVFNNPYFRMLAEKYGNPAIECLDKVNVNEYRRRVRNHPRTEHYGIVCDLVDTHNARFKQLQQTFGADIPNQHSRVVLHALTPDELAYVWHGHNMPDVYTHESDRIAWLVATTQDKLRDLTPTDLAFRIPYAEKNGSNAELYAEVNHRWLLDCDAPPTDEEIRQFHAVQPSQELERLLLDCESNELRRKKLCDLVQKNILHAKRTGEITDMSGKGNVFISAAGDLWAPDILYPVKVKVIEKLPKAVRRIQNNEGPTAFYLSYLMNGLGFVRTMNYLAALNGLPDRLRLFDDLDVQPDTWQKVHTLLKNSSTFVQLHANTIAY